ncbi:hypothetical protein NA57DRAFT_78128 [Rhizodiscina lignyota]|uniref:Uncharacterized protein n=1 Tax=Rhizodiscina lignyota TaxID=1504668 RepID=A0A9P4IC26_9PEZI|nr:hypothetical protein NA57DRAFT_78128 [Rhizodiscina lignyota]
MDPGIPAPRCADPETLLQTNEMILEYLFYNATKALLAERRAAKEGSTLEHASMPDLPLQMVDAFLPIFRHNHSADTIDDKLRFRLRLLKFATLFTRRFVQSGTTPSAENLEALRQTLETRASEWFAEVEETLEVEAYFMQLGLPADRLQHTKDSFAHQLSLSPTSAAFYGTPESVSLLDVLPSFLVASSAMRDVFSTNITQMFMELAAEFMMQASLEQYLAYGNRGADPLKMCFAWGWRETPSSALQEEQEINKMFRDEDLDQEVDGWAAVRTGYVRRLQPPSDDININKHLEHVAMESNIGLFEDKILNFLEAMLQAIDPPDLEQLERGQVAGLSHEETEELMQHVGFHSTN